MESLGSLDVNLLDSAKSNKNSFVVVFKVFKRISGFRILFFQAVQLVNGVKRYTPGNLFHLEGFMLSEISSFHQNCAPLNAT